MNDNNEKTVTDYLEKYLGRELNQEDYEKTEVVRRFWDGSVVRIIFDGEDITSILPEQSRI